MVELHKWLLRGRRRVSIVETPYGFQENADELTAKTRAYFADRVGVPSDVITLRSADGPALQLGAALAAAQNAEYLFAGPGSPTYALRQWRRLTFGPVLQGVVDRGGVVTLASAASITAGVLSLPVYEIYKVGEHPYWEQGIDLLAHVGITAAVVPHFNNAEGGTHDTSCCYVGKRRLEMLRSQRPEVPVLGIDEHTALVIDPQDLSAARVVGLGQVHMLNVDSETHVGSSNAIDLTTALHAVAPSAKPLRPEDEPTFLTSLASAIADQDPSQVLSALVQLSDADPTTTATLTTLLPVLGAGWLDSARPFRDLLLQARQRARDERAWAVSDLIRDGMDRLGYSVEDTADGQRIREAPSAPD